MNDLHLVLHGLAIKKHGVPETIAEVAGLAEDRVRTLLARAVDTGRAVESQGGYLLSPAGRLILDGHYSRWCEALRRDAAFVEPCEQFERLNVELKQLITDWQTIEIGGERIRNDHADRAYDARIIDRLGGVHERLEPILARLAARLPRLAVYKDKLERALTRAEDGACEWVSDARLDSYHTVWFELHEDLLRILGRARDE